MIRIVCELANFVFVSWISLKRVVIDEIGKNCLFLFFFCLISTHMMRKGVEHWICLVHCVEIKLKESKKMTLLKSSCTLCSDEIQEIRTWFADLCTVWKTYRIFNEKAAGSLRLVDMYLFFVDASEYKIYEKYTFVGFIFLVCHIIFFKGKMI